MELDESFYEAGSCFGSDFFKARAWHDFSEGEVAISVVENGEVGDDHGYCLFCGQG